jgi:hypothetical protein
LRAKRVSVRSITVLAARLGNGEGGFNVNDDAELHVDQIVVE